MIEVVRGDIFDSVREALVNPVNCVGSMGAGLALGFRENFPRNYQLYCEACRRGEVRIGRMFVHQIRDSEWNELSMPKYIINFPTKFHWGGASTLHNIEVGMQALVEEIRERKIGSIAIPALGCGLGGLRWADVLPRIEGPLSELPLVRARIYEPV